MARILMLKSIDSFNPKDHLFTDNFVRVGDFLAHLAGDQWATYKNSFNIVLLDGMLLSVYTTLLSHVLKDCYPSISSPDTLGEVLRASKH